MLKTMVSTVSAMLGEQNGDHWAEITAVNESAGTNVLLVMDTYGEMEAAKLKAESSMNFTWFQDDKVGMFYKLL